MKWNDRNKKGKIQNSKNSTKSSEPTGQLGATSLPPIGDSLMYIETSQNNSGIENIFVSFERTDLIQTSNISFYHYSFSILTNDSVKLLGGFGIQPLLEDSTWSARYCIPKNDRYSDSLAHWTLVNSNFAVGKCFDKIMYDQIELPDADVCFSIIAITHPLFYMNHVIYIQDFIESIQVYRKIILFMFCLNLVLIY